MSKLFPKTLAICLVLCLVCALAIGCSVIDPQPTEPTEPAPTEPAPTECAHVWVDATCTTPKTCSVCSETEGEALGHKWNDANCTTAKTCSVCSATEGEALGHKWNDANCTTAKTCSVCPATEGEALGHKWNDANCTTAKTCSVCSATEGEANGHTWADATCTTPKTCSVCSATEGNALGHAYKNSVCATCGDERKLTLQYRWGNGNTLQVNTNLPATTPIANFLATDNGCSIDQSVNKYQWFGWAGMANAEGTIVITLNFNNAFAAGQTYILPAGAIFGFTDGSTYVLDKQYVFIWDGSNWTVSDKEPEPEPEPEPEVGELSFQYRYGTNKLIQMNTNLPATTPLVNFTAGDNGCSIDQSGNQYQQVGWIQMDNAGGTIVLTFHFNSEFAAGQTYVLPAGAVFGFTDGSKYTLDKDYTFLFDGNGWSIVEPGQEPEANSMAVQYRWGNGNTLQVNTDLPAATPIANFLATDNGCSINQSGNQQVGWIGMVDADGVIVLTFNFNSAFEAGQTYVLSAGSIFGFADGSAYVLNANYTFTWDGSNWAMTTN